MRRQPREKPSMVIRTAQPYYFRYLHDGRRGGLDGGEDDKVGSSARAQPKPNQERRHPAARRTTRGRRRRRKKAERRHITGMRGPGPAGGDDTPRAQRCPTKKKNTEPRHRAHTCQDANMAWWN